MMTEENIPTTDELENTTTERAPGIYENEIPEMATSLPLGSEIVRAFFAHFGHAEVAGQIQAITAELHSLEGWLRDATDLTRKAMPRQMSGEAEHYLARVNRLRLQARMEITRKAGRLAGELLEELSAL